MGSLLLLAQLCQGADPLDHWTLRKVGNNNYFTSVAYGGGQFVVTGSDTNRTSLLVTSTDGANWTSGHSATTNSLNDVTYGKGKFVAVGDNGTIILSPDGTNWTKAISGTSNILTSVAYGNDQYIATGFMFTYSGLASTDGTNWTSIHLVSPSPTAIRYAAGQFILLSITSILTSTNGGNWTYRFHANPGTSYSDVAFGNGRFVAVGGGADVGGSGNIANSPDAVTWSPLNTGSDNVLYSVAFGGGRFVAAGGFNGGEGGLIFSSPDGVDWTPHPPGTRGWLQDVAYGNGRFVAVGSFSGILSTEPIITLEPIPALASSNPQFKISGPPGQSFRIQASTDLANWLTLTNMVCPDGVGQFVDLSATNFSQRFYQAVSP